MSQPDSAKNLRLYVRLVDLPPSQCGEYQQVQPGIQHKKEVKPGARQPDGSIRFTCEVRVERNVKTGALNFLGPYVFGKPEERFLYISWSGVKNGSREMFRRMKIQLQSITASQLTEVLGQPDAYLEVAVSGRAKDGGPACATVPLMENGWKAISV
jgi:hypothetical protein